MYADSSLPDYGGKKEKKKYHDGAGYCLEPDTRARAATNHARDTREME